MGLIRRGDRRAGVVFLRRARRAGRFWSMVKKSRSRRGPVGGFALSEADDAWLRRGRNAVGRRGPRRLAASVYADASGLECLAGALYVSDGDRCRALLAALAAIDEASPT